MSGLPRSHLVWMLVNLAGMAAFLAIASQVWIEPEVADVPGANVGNAFAWLVSAVPILLLFAIGNLGWMAMSIFKRRTRLSGLAVGAVVIACWIVAFLFDNAHHGI